jgi:hypothetical protein
MGHGRVQTVVYMLVHCIDESLTRTPEATEDRHRRLRAWAEDNTSRGIKLHGTNLYDAGLGPVGTATTVSVRADEVIVSDGPFAETKEQTGGYDLIECADLGEAIQVASTHPASRTAAIEIRPVLHP